MREEKGKPDAAPLPPGYKLADEGQKFSVPTDSMVKYGADTRWTVKHVDAHAKIKCGDDYFGVDPAEGVKKSCYIDDLDEAPPTEPPVEPPVDPPVDPPVEPPVSGGSYRELAYGWMGPRGIEFRFGSPSTRTDMPTLEEKFPEGVIQDAGGSYGEWSYGPPDYNAYNAYMTVNATVIGVAPTLSDATARVQNGAVNWSAALLKPQIPWQSGTLVPPELETYFGQNLLSNDNPADLPVATFRGESGGDSPNTRVSVVMSQGSPEIPAKMYTLGTVTATNRTLMEFPLGMVPTCAGVTNYGEFALVPLMDTNTETGKLAVVSLGEGPDGWEPGRGQSRYNEDGSTWWHTWGDDMHPGHAGQGNFCFMKLIAIIDLPFSQPTDIKVSTGMKTTSHVDYYPQGHPNAGQITSYMETCTPLSNENNRKRLAAGGDSYHKYAKGGVAVVISKAEKKVAFIDLGPLFKYTNGMYFDSNETNAITQRMGYGEGDWPFPLQSNALPQVVQTFDLDDEPVACWVSPSHNYWSKDDEEREYEPDGPFHPAPHFPKAGVITKNGKFVMYSTGQYVAGPQPTQPTPDGIREIGWIEGLGNNITCMAISKGHPDLKDSYNDSAIYVAREDRKIGLVDWVTNPNDGSVSFMQQTLAQDSRMDPTWCAEVDNYATKWHTVSVADPTNRCVHNYRFGELKYSEPAPWSPASCPPEGHYGGKQDLNCSPYILHCSNVP